VADTGPFHPYLLAWGLCASGALAGHGALDLLPTVDPIGPAALVAAALSALVGGTAAGLLLGPRLEPPEQRGGGRALAVVLIGLVALSFAHRPLPVSAELGSAVLSVVLRSAPWALALALVPIIGTIPDLTLGRRETSHDARLRRATSYWFTAWGAPATALMMLMMRGWTGLPFWVLALLVPLAPLLMTFGVRVGEVDLLSRSARIRLAAVSWIATLPVLAVGVAREMAP
jgi:hypothetical protein